MHNQREQKLIFMQLNGAGQHLPVHNKLHSREWHGQQGKDRKVWYTHSLTLIYGEVEAKNQCRFLLVF